MRANPSNCEVEVDLYTLAKLGKIAGKKDMTVSRLVSFLVERFIEPKRSAAAKHRSYAVAQ